ncbi:MAG: four helix bundle protein [Clostridia bacterium]|nr:four helix bundle protein [Clostridia bacterium]
MQENIIENKSFSFAIRIVNLYKYLINEKNEKILSKQLLRSGTSIGANISEAQRGQTLPDFASKMNIALKEANETLYWIKLLYHTDYITKKQFNSMHKDIDELISILISICKTTREKLI